MIDRAEKMTGIVSRFINFSIPRPDYLDGLGVDYDQCCGLVFETQYKGKTLYVGLGGGRFQKAADCELRETKEDDEICFTPIGHLVFDIIQELPVESPSITIAEISDETAKAGAILERLYRIFDVADNHTKIMIVGDFTKALDGKVTPLLGVTGIVEVKELTACN
jgi:hypothetical protein